MNPAITKAVKYLNDTNHTHQFFPTKEEAIWQSQVIGKPWFTTWLGGVKVYSVRVGGSN